ncbi:M12 family metallopeptidase [Luteolibacter arcticus]|uniref:M12 family metallopeptidase n=1 Tax=Luteolibacter arcticus TaxID=1581411 RepID=A0ABT3GPG1_9BACT|nr:M12 family metallopeptidase [Luteolibacter arcticus]MCW1925403.1 M12 family metallopeptidase [Luteolibacter arcticus]
MTPRAGIPALLFLWSATLASGGLYPNTISPGNVPWPGGVVPYVFDAGLSAAQRQIYLAGLREFELAANVQFIPRTAETQHVLFKYDPQGPNRVSGSQPQLVEINSLRRGQICHEMGHSFGLEHEHQRPDQGLYIEVLEENIYPGNEHLFQVAAGMTPFGPYDFESVMHYGRDVLSVPPGVLDTIQVKPGFSKYQLRLGNYALSPGDRALMAFLYGPPVVAPSPIVTTTADGGPGSLRAAIYFAQDHPSTPVTFNIPTSDPGHSAGIFTIKPTSFLPPLATDGLVIDATTQPGFAGQPVVFLDGSAMPIESGDAPGLLIRESACRVKGLGIIRFPWCGIVMELPDATGNVVSGCWIGLNAAGIAAPNVKQGIQLSDGASGNTIGGTAPADRNVLSGNGEYGVWMSGSATAGNSVLGNPIGTNPAGTAAVANGSGGVIVTGGAHHQTIGSAAAGNLISGNVSAGLWLTGAGVSDNVVRGNRFGTNFSGNAAVPNGFAGANIINGAADNLISGNVFSGNVSEGLRLAGSGTTGNLVEGNRAGTNAAGTAALPNGFVGIAVYQGATGNRIEGNLLSGNGTVGLAFADAGTSDNLAAGNFIGTDVTGTAPLSNGFAGVYLTGGCNGNWLGDGPGSGNLISGNAVIGVLIADPATHGNIVRNNRIGPDANGALSLSNQDDGIRIQNGAQVSMIGGSASGAANVIAGNTARGIALFNAATAGHAFSRNSIHGNGWQGIGVYDGSNGGQAAPVLSAATLGVATHVTGSLSGQANSSHELEFFSSESGSPSSGRHFLGATTATTNGAGVATIDLVLPAPIPAGGVITATARGGGGTSEFSNGVTVTTTDSDSDGLPDAYESTIPGLSSANAADAGDDFDADGFSNLDEYLAGTAPRDPASRLFATGQRSGESFVVSFPSVPGQTYRVDAAVTPSGPWLSEAMHLHGTGGTMDVTLPASGPRRFFRVITGP